MGIGIFEGVCVSREEVFFCRIFGSNVRFAIFRFGRFLNLV